MYGTGPHFEDIDSGEWTASAVAHREPEIYSDVTDIFILLDPREITKTVLDHRQVDLMYAIQALDDLFGEIVDPYADEDDD